jgi:MFS family permease
VVKTGIGRLLQIEQGNRPMILALLLQAVATGIFVGGIELEANAAFLETHGADRIPMAMMMSGVAGILIATIYSYFSKQLGVRPFGILNLVAAMAITVALLVGFRFMEQAHFDFVIFILAGPMGLITLLGFWITVREYLSPSRGKQLGGLIEATLIGGMIVAFVTVPVLVKLGIILQNVLYITVVSLVVATGAQLFVLNRIGKLHTRFRKRVFSTGPVLLFSHKFTGLISSFAVMSVAVAVLLQYLFLSVAEIRYPGGVDLVAFLGYFSAIAAALAWMVKRFLFGWIKQRFGVRTTLLLSPALLLLLTIASAIAGERYGFSTEANFFTYFFIMVVLAKFFGKTMKDSMEYPSLNLIYKALDPRERHYIKSGIEGVLSQIALFVSGLLLAFFVMLSFVQVYHATYVLFVLLVIWFFVGLALYRNYHRLLKVTLESDRLKVSADRGLEEMAEVDLSQTAFPVELLEFNPYYFHYTSREHLVGLLTHPHAGVRKRIWDHLLHTSPGLPELTINQLMIREKEPAIKERIRTLSKRKLRSRLGLQEAFIKERLDRFIREKQEPENVIEKAFHSGITNEVYAALYHVAEKHDQSYLPEVVSLFRNDDPSIQSVAISTAGIISSGENGTRLIGFLEDPRQYSYAWSSLVRQGETVLDDLETAFHKPGASLKLQLRIISVISAIGGLRASQLLLDKLDYHHREIFSYVVRGLFDNHYQASEIQVALIQNAIIKMVHTGTWNMAARISVRTDDPGGSLARAIEHEIWEVNELVLMLMSLVYDRKSVQRIRLILLDRQAEDKGMAIELLELLLSEPLKSVLIAYFHDVTVREKIDKLRELYPIHIFPVETLLKRILNRDGTQMGDFIRICVLERMGNEPRFFDEQQIIAQGFHPNPKIRETAAQLLRKNDPERYHMVTERLDFPDNSFPGHEDVARWYTETTMKLTSWDLFAKVGINALFKLVSVLLPYSEEQLSEGDYVVLARSASSEEFSPLSSGIAIIAEHQPEILEQIRYLGTIGTCDTFLAERDQFIEQLFDERSLLHVFCDFLNQSR